MNGVAVATSKSYPSGELTQSMSEQIDRIGSLDYLSEQLDQIAVDKGWDASFVVDGDENQHQINSSLIRTVKTINDLSLIANPKNKQIIYVESIQKTFIYDENLDMPENGVTIIEKWEMQLQDAYFASWFATRNSPVDQAQKLQTGWDYASLKNREFIFDGEYHVALNARTYPDGLVRKIGLQVPNDSYAEFTDGACIKVIPNAEQLGYIS